MASYRLARCALVVSATLILFGSTACKREAIGVATSFEQKRVLQDDQTLTWKTFSVTIKLDDGRTVILKGDDAQAAADLISKSESASGAAPNQEFRLRLRRSWLGRWHVVEVLQAPNAGGPP